MSQKSWRRLCRKGAEKEREFFTSFLPPGPQHSCLIDREMRIPAVAVALLRAAVVHGFLASPRAPPLGRRASVCAFAAVESRTARILERYDAEGDGGGAGAAGTLAGLRVRRAGCVRKCVG